MATEVKRVTKEKAVVEVRHVEEEWRKVELEEQQRAMAVAKVWAEEAKAHWVTEEELVAAAVARCRAILATVETVAEEAGMEQDGGSPSKQKAQAEGKWLVCNHCMTRGFDCQVSWKKICFCPSAEDG